MKNSEEPFYGIAEELLKLRMWPFFDIAHFIMAAQFVRHDIGLGVSSFSRLHPLSCYVSTMFTIFSSNIIVHGLTSIPVITSLTYTKEIIVASIIWYFMFYSPCDIFYTFISVIPIQIIFSSMNEINRCRSIYEGISTASDTYSEANIPVLLVIGVLKGNGSSFAKIFARLMRGKLALLSGEFLHPSFATKASLVASVMFIIKLKTDLIPISEPLIFFGVVLFFMYFKVTSILLGVTDPFIPFEHLFCAILLGGMWERFVKLYYKIKEKYFACAYTNL